MISNLPKKAWTMFTESLGTSIIHPQSLLIRFQQDAVNEAKKYVKAMPAGRRGKLVDIGCGRMPYRTELEPLVESYIGVDHPEVSKLYPSSVKPDVLADAKYLPFKAGTFDIALLFQVLEHVDSPSEVVKEAGRILKPNGTLIISIPFFYPLHDMPHDWGRYTSSALKNFLIDAGFKVIKIKEQGGFFQFWLQMLNTFLAKRIYDMIKSQTIINFLFLAPTLVISIPTIILNNLFILLFTHLSKVIPKYPNYFPLQYVVVAKKVK